MMRPTLAAPVPDRTVLGCGAHVDDIAHKFLTEMVKRFGRPTEPIRIRVPKT